MTPWEQMPQPLRGAVGDDITVTCAAAGAGNTRIDVTAIGWKA